MSEDEPKSAIELAMERMRKKDADEGTSEKPMNDAQKAAIAEARSICSAKLAELEILHKSKLVGVDDPEARRAFGEFYRVDVQRATDERERKIAKIRKSGRKG